MIAKLTDGMIYDRAGIKWVGLRDHRGQLRRMSARSGSRAVADRLLRNLYRLRDAAGVGADPPDELVDWIMLQLDARRRGQLVRWGLISERRLAVHTTLGQHVDAWQRALEHGNTDRHATQQAERVRKVIAQVDVERFEQLTGDRLAAALGELRTAKQNQQPKPLSKSTQNAYRTAVIGFARWMIDHGRASRLPDGLRLVKRHKISKGQRQVQRRRLTDAELAKLMAVEDPNRRLVYIVALNTGLRADEVRRTTLGDIDLEHGILHVWGKSQKDQTVPINSELRAALEARLQRERLASEDGEVDPEARLCFVAQKTAKWVRQDTGSQDIDFHCLRHTYGTRLAEAGVPPHVLQALMRHSTIQQTMGYYVHLSLGDDSRAVEALVTGRLQDDEAPSMRIGG